MAVKKGRTFYVIYVGETWAVRGVAFTEPEVFSVAEPGDVVYKVTMDVRYMLRESKRTLAKTRGY